MLRANKKDEKPVEIVISRVFVTDRNILVIGSEKVTPIKSSEKVFLIDGESNSLKRSRILRTDLDQVHFSLNGWRPSYFIFSLNQENAELKKEAKKLCEDYLLRLKQEVDKAAFQIIAG